MALINPCIPGSTIKNTGVECSDKMLATYMLVMMPQAAFWTGFDELDFTGYTETMTHAPLATRWWPLFGRNAKINGITDSPESDVIEKMDDGSSDFIRNGMYNRTFLTTKGGDCFAKALAAMDHNYAFVEIDAEGKVKRMVNADGTFSGFPVNLAYAPTPELANLKTTFKNKFNLDFSPIDYIQHGSIVKGDATEDILSVRGLFDTEVYQVAVPASSGGTAATGGYTVVKGATNDTIIPKVSGVAISASVLQTSSESTDTLLAAKIVAAINAATTTNGGYSAANTAGAITITAPVGLGASINTVQATATIVGTITTTTPVAFSGGATGTSILKVGVKTICGETDLIALYGVALVVAGNFVVTNAAGTVITISLAAITGGVAFLTIPRVNGVYTVSLAAPSVLKSAGIEGYEGTVAASTTIV